MKKLKNLIQNQLPWIIIGGVFFLGSIYLILKGPFIGNDSFDYLEMDITRSAGYPFVLFLLRKIFGENYLFYTVIFQVITNAVIIIYFLRSLSENYKVNAYKLLLLVPFPLYYFIEIVAPNKILTESITFTFFLFIVILTIDSLNKKKLNGLSIALILNAFLVTIRGQFLLLFPFLLLLAGYIIFRNRELFEFKTISKFLILLLITFMMSSIINRTYHYYFHDSFSAPHFKARFIANSMYVSSESDSSLFGNELHAKIHRDLYDSLYSNRVNRDAFINEINPDIEPQERRRSDLIAHYHNSYNEIASTIKDNFDQQNYLNLKGADFFLEKDKILKEMAMTIIKSDIKKYVYVNFSDIFVFGFNNNRIYFILFFIVYMFSFYGLVKRNKLAEVIFLFMSVYLMNFILISLSNRVLPRYTFYYEFVILTFLLLGTVKIFSKE